MSGLYEQIYNLVKQVPEGKVTTYGEIALATGNPRRSRVVGTAMQKCKDNTVPCHRVIRKDGSLPVVFGIGGSSYRRFLLESEGVNFMPDGKVDLKKHMWLF